MNTYQNRGTGRTTRQIQNMPPGWCIFIVHNLPMVAHARCLCEQLGRDDIQVKSVSWLDGTGWMGLRPQGVTVDHFVWEDLHNKRSGSTGDALRNALDYWRAGGAMVA